MNEKPQGVCLWHVEVIDKTWNPSPGARLLTGLSACTTGRRPEGRPPRCWDRSLPPPDHPSAKRNAPRVFWHPFWIEQAVKDQHEETAPCQKAVFSYTAQSPVAPGPLSSLHRIHTRGGVLAPHTCPSNWEQPVTSRIPSPLVLVLLPSFQLLRARILLTIRLLP